MKKNNVKIKSKLLKVKKSNKKEFILLIIIFLIAFLLRIIKINYGLPYIYHPDEPRYINIIQNIFKTGDLNPHFFNYPTLFFYLNAIAYTPYYIIGKAIGVFSSRLDILSPIILTMGTTKSPLPSSIILSRLVTVIFGSLTIIMMFFIGKELTNRTSVGLLSAFLMAVCPVNIIHSRFITPDTFLVFFITTSIYSIILVYKKGSFWNYILSGICIGFTISSKYNGALIILPLIFAHILRYKKESIIKIENLIIALEVCVITFIITTPFSIFDFHKFITDVTFESKHYYSGHAGMEGNALQYYTNYMLKTMFIIFIFSLLEIIRSYYFHLKEYIIFSIFPICYFIFICNFKVVNDRTFLPLTPFLFVFASSFIIKIYYIINKLKILEINKITLKIIIVLVSVSVFIQPIKIIYKDILEINKIHDHDIAREWIYNNIHVGKKIAIESYSPFIEPDKYFVIGFQQIIDKTPAWYENQGFDYLVFSKKMYGRFYYNKNKYKDQVAKYEEFFNKYKLLKRINSISIYKLKD